MNKTHVTVRGCCGLILGVAITTHATADDIVVIMARGATTLAKDRIAAVYLGRSTELKPVDLPQSNLTRREFYWKTTNRDVDQVKAVWMRLVFTGKGQPPREVPDDDAVKKAVASDSQAIGYIRKSSVDESVEVVLDLN